MALGISYLDTQVLQRIRLPLGHNFHQEQLMAFHIFSHGILVQLSTVLSTYKLIQGLTEVIDTLNLDTQDQIDNLR